MEDLERIRSDPVRSSYCLQKVLCHTLAGNEVPLLTITNLDSPIHATNKQIVFLSGRVHPGESPSSWIMRKG